MIYKIQKASFTKRVSAMLFDFMMIVVVFLACAFPMSALLQYDKYIDEREAVQESILAAHKIEELESQYPDNENVNFIKYDQVLTEEEKAALPEEIQIAFKACQDDINSNEDIARLTGTLFILFITIFSTSLLMSFIILEFIVPLLFKNGQTLGKKIFALGVVRIDSVKVSPFILFVRTVLGKFTICTMVPLITFPIITSMPLVPIFFILLILLLHVVFYITSGTGALIHDKMAATAVVDMQTQMIFDSVEAREEYQLRIHREEVSKADY